MIYFFARSATIHNFAAVITNIVLIIIVSFFVAILVYPMVVYLQPTEARTLDANLEKSATDELLPPR